MWTDCKKFVLHCVLCAHKKPSLHRPYSLLQPLPVPGVHSTLSVIEQLPISNDLPLSWWLLTACPRKVLSFQLRTLLLPRTLQVHSFPMCSQSMAPLSMCPPTADWNSPLPQLPPSNAPTLTSGRHPSAKGQVERVNSTVGQYLRMFCNYEQDNWSTLLPPAKVAPSPPISQRAYSLSSGLAAIIHWPRR